jgi:gas vesicle protein
MGGGGGGAVQGIVGAMGTVVGMHEGAKQQRRAIAAAEKGAELQAETQREINAANILANREAQERALKFAREQQRVAQEAVAPWREQGAGALKVLQEKMAAGPGEFRPEEIPGYEYGYRQFIEKPLQAQASATGSLRSGALQKELSKQAQDYTNTQYDNFLNRFYSSLQPYQSMAGLGQTSGLAGANIAGQLGQSGSNILSQFVPQTPPDVSSQYAARAAGEMGMGKIYGDALTGISRNILPVISQYGQYNRQQVQPQVTSQPASWESYYNNPEAME